MEIQVPKEETCDHCHGNGAEPGSKVDTCPDCHGTGQQRVVQNTPFGQMVNVRTCSRCGGTGKIIHDKCKKCHGTGTVKVRKKLKIKIPAGVDDGARLRVAGEGEPGVRGGGHGDLYVYIFVRRDPKFTREGNDILSQETISFAQAALGSKILVETLDGKIELTIPAGTQTGTVFRIRGTTSRARSPYRRTSTPNRRNSCGNSPMLAAKRGWGSQSRLNNRPTVTPRARRATRKIRRRPRRVFGVS